MLVQTVKLAVMGALAALLLVAAAALALSPSPPVVAVATEGVDLSALRRVETSGAAPDYPAHSRIAGGVALREGATAAAIVGGRAAVVDEVPGAVLIRSRFTLEDGREGYSLCSGTILADLGSRYVLTAAHCVLDGASKKYDRFDVFYGADGPPTPEGMARLWGQRAYVSPDYDPEQGVSGGGDVALIELAEPARLEPHQMARLATLDEARALTTGAPVIVAGWGTTKGGPASGRDASPVLKMARVGVARAGLVSIELRDEAGRVEGACQGDSGGAARLASDPRIVVGVLSLTRIEGGGSCVAAGYAQVYTGAAYARLALGAI